MIRQNTLIIANRPQFVGLWITWISVIVVRASIDKNKGTHLLISQREANKKTEAKSRLSSVENLVDWNAKVLHPQTVIQTTVCRIIAGISFAIDPASVITISIGNLGYIFLEKTQNDLPNVCAINLMILATVFTGFIDTFSCSLFRRIICT